MIRVLKFETGQAIPEGAIYCGTVTQTERMVDRQISEPGYPLKYKTEVETCWLVWHYFLVEEKDVADATTEDNVKWLLDHWDNTDPERMKRELNAVIPLGVDA